ncbi:MAG: protein kinase [Candidatus Riflebacteria bacterium]|nr:protein kinase [Candidatus Riflebacteria bacterium]
MSLLSPKGRLDRMETPFPPGCASRYRAERLLSSGGFGSVYLASQLSLGRTVAVKVPRSQILLDVAESARFCNEARATASLSHPHIVTVVDFDVEDGWPWIAYEYLSGKTLSDQIDQGPLSFEEALRIARQMASALEEVHGHGIIHRDVKPRNIIEVSPARYKLVDFGIAKWNDESSHRTTVGRVLGTPLYTAPELLMGMPPTPRSDLYSLGIVLFEMLTGRHPFDRNFSKMLESINAVTGPTPGSLRSGVPGEIDMLVRRALARFPDERFESAAKLGEAIEAALGETGSVHTTARERLDEADPPARVPGAADAPRAPSVKENPSESNLVTERLVLSQPRVGGQLDPPAGRPARSRPVGRLGDNLTRQRPTVAMISVVMGIALLVGLALVVPWRKRQSSPGLPTPRPTDSASSRSWRPPTDQDTRLEDDLQRAIDRNHYLWAKWPGGIPLARHDRFDSKVLKTSQDRHVGFIRRFEPEIGALLAAIARVEARYPDVESAPFRVAVMLHHARTQHCVTQLRVARVRDAASLMDHLTPEGEVDLLAVSSGQSYRDYTYDPAVVEPVCRYLSAAALLARRMVRELDQMGLFPGLLLGRHSWVGEELSRHPFRGKARSRLRDECRASFERQLASLTGPREVLISRTLSSLWGFWDSGPDRAATIDRRVFDDLTEVCRLAPESGPDLGCLRRELEVRRSRASPGTR